MKNITLIIAALLIIQDALVAQGTIPFKISGKINNAPVGSYIYLETNSQPVQRIDSTKVGKGNTFTITGKVADGGDAFVLNVGGKQKIILLIEGNEVLHITSQHNKTGKVFITGSTNMNYYDTLTRLSSDMQAKGIAVKERLAEANKIKDHEKAVRIEKEYQIAQQAATNKVKAMIPAMGTSLVSLYALNFINIDSDFPTYDTLARKFMKEKPNSAQAKFLIESVTKLKKIAIGAEAPEIVLADTMGVPIALSSLRGKIILIDFWASWCRPCRIENPKLVQIYDKYKDKGFAIYGVSLDQARPSWTAAIRKDHLTWTNVSDLKFWKSAAAQQYFIQAVPATFLIGRDGKIIARNLRGDALEQRLKDVLSSK